MNEACAPRLRQGLEGNVVVEDGFGGERRYNCASNLLTCGAYMRWAVCRRVGCGGVCEATFLMDGSADVEDEVRGKCKAVLAVHCDLLDTFKCPCAYEDEEGDGEYKAMPHPMIHAVTASATQDAGADVVWGWAYAGEVVVGAGVGPRCFTWHVSP